MSQGSSKIVMIHEDLLVDDLNIISNDYYVLVLIKVKSEAQIVRSWVVFRTCWTLPLSLAEQHF